MKKTLLCLIFIYVSVRCSRGNECSPKSCKDNFESIQSLSKSITDIRDQLKYQSTELRRLQNNLVPIGFIYVQLPQQSAPFDLWGTATWHDVTNEYAGLFFRALGGSAEPFGTIQDASCPRLTEVQTTSSETHVYYNYIYANNDWSEGVASGMWITPPNGHWRLRFKQSSDEVRPRNTGVRIWKRVN